MIFPTLLLISVASDAKIEDGKSCGEGTQAIITEKGECKHKCYVTARGRDKRAAASTPGQQSINENAAIAEPDQGDARGGDDAERPSHQTPEGQDKVKPVLTPPVTPDLPSPCDAAKAEQIAARTEYLDLKYKDWGEGDISFILLQIRHGLLNVRIKAKSERSACFTQIQQRDCERSLPATEKDFTPETRILFEANCLTKAEQQVCNDAKTKTSEGQAKEKEWVACKLETDDDDKWAAYKKTLKHPTQREMLGGTRRLAATQGKTSCEDVQQTCQETQTKEACKGDCTWVETPGSECSDTSVMSDSSGTSVTSVTVALMAAISLL